MMREVQFFCPICDTDIRLPESALFTTCPGCQKRLDVKSQLAYYRGLEAFEEGQEAMLKLSPRKLRLFNPPPESHAVNLLKEAYSSLQLAFEGELVEAERHLGIEMMASMAQEFSKRWFVSDFEGQYWRAVMAELVSQREYDALSKKLKGRRGAADFFLVRWYWKVRQHQLRAVIKDFNRKLALMEQQINFIETPNARDRQWTPE